MLPDRVSGSGVGLYSDRDEMLAHLVRRSGTYESAAQRVEAWLVSTSRLDECAYCTDNIVW